MTKVVTRFVNAKLLCNDQETPPTTATRNTEPSRMPDAPVPHIAYGDLDFTHCRKAPQGRCAAPLASEPATRQPHARAPALATALASTVATSTLTTAFAPTTVCVCLSVAVSTA